MTASFRNILSVSDRAHPVNSEKLYQLCMEAGPWGHASVLTEADTGIISEIRQSVWLSPDAFPTELFTLIRDLYSHWPELSPGSLHVNLILFQPGFQIIPGHWRSAVDREQLYRITATLNENQVLWQATLTSPMATALFPIPGGLKELLHETDPAFCLQHSGQLLLKEINKWPAQRNACTEKPNQIILNIRPGHIEMLLSQQGIPLAYTFQPWLHEDDVLYYLFRLAGQFQATPENCHLIIPGDFTGGTSLRSKLSAFFPEMIRPAAPSSFSLQTDLSAVSAEAFYLLNQDCQCASSEVHIKEG